MAQLPYNPENPPQDPPTGADRVLWVIAIRLYQEHVGTDGMCLAPTCRQQANLWPCESYNVARAGLLFAVREAVIPAPVEPWHPVTRIRRLDSSSH